nr:hypothetical protein [Tanacetum cinerariifolium]
MSSYNHFGCSCCGGPFNGGNCPSCSSAGSRNEFVYDPNPSSFDNPPDFSYHPPQPQYETYSCELCGNDSHYGYDCPPWNCPAFYDDDHDNGEESFIPLRDTISELPLSVAITPNFSITDSLIIEDKHLDTIPETESDEEYESSVEDLNLPPNSSIISSFKIDYLLGEFSGKLAHIDLIPSGINETNFDPEEEIHLVEKLLYANSSPRPLEEFNSENSDAVIESFSPSPIPVEGSDSLMEEIDIFIAPDDSMPPGLPRIMKPLVLVVKDKQEKDKIETKSDKNEKRGKARQCQKSVTVKKAEKRSKYKVKGPILAILRSCIDSIKRQGLILKFYQSYNQWAETATFSKLLCPRTDYAITSITLKGCFCHSAKLKPYLD